MRQVATLNDKNSRRPWLCIIGASRSHLPFIEAALHLNFNTLVFDRDGDAPGVRVATRFEAISTHDADDIMSKCNELIQHGELLGCITYVSDERALTAAAKVIEEFSLPGFKPIAVVNTSNKYRMKACLEREGIPTPQFGIIRSLAELYEFLVEHKQAIIKPAFGGTGSAGVALVFYGGQQNNQAFQRAQQESANDEVIAEVYTPGQEYSIDGYVQRGRITVLGIAHKFTLGPKHHFVINGFATGGLGRNANKEYEKVLEELIDLGYRVVATLEIDDSFFSIDVVSGEQGLVVVDVGLLLDAKIDRLLYFSGLDVYELRCRLAIGEKATVYQNRAVFGSGYALRFLYSSKYGKFHPVQEGMINGMGDTGVCRTRVEWNRQAGEVVAPPESLADTVGWLMVEASDRFAAWELASEQRLSNLFSVEAIQ